MNKGSKLLMDLLIPKWSTHCLFVQRKMLENIILAEGEIMT